MVDARCCHARAIRRGAMLPLPAMRVQARMRQSALLFSRTLALIRRHDVVYMRICAQRSAARRTWKAQRAAMICCASVRVSHSYDAVLTFI